MDYILKAETGHINFSPVGFRLVAEDFLRCFETFLPAKFSVVPFFLCCRAIELALKALHLETRSQADVKKDFGHDLKASYDALPSEKHLLSPSDVELLKQTNSLYMSKAFEYMQSFEAGTAFSSFPRLEDLADLARRVMAL